jgi:SAM-dependent methyltransferase
LNRLVGLDDQVFVRQADITDLPFADASFDVVLSQHVQMNVPDKTRLYSEARRVLVSSGRLALWDITIGQGEVDYPLPWATGPEVSHLVTPEQLKSSIESAGFEIEFWNDLTDQAASIMQALLALPPSPLGLHAFVADFAEKAGNLTAALSDGRLRAIQGVARATD